MTVWDIATAVDVEKSSILRILRTFQDFLLSSPTRKGICGRKRKTISKNLENSNEKQHNKSKKDKHRPSKGFIRLWQRSATCGSRATCGSLDVKLQLFSSIRKYYLFKQKKKIQNRSESINEDLALILSLSHLYQRIYKQKKGRLTKLFPPSSAS